MISIAKKQLMNKKRSLVKLSTLTGKSITMGSTTVTPISRRISLGFPQWVNPDNGFVMIHQRPTALIVKNGQKEQVIRILDVQFLILTLIVLSGIFSLLIFRSKKEQNDERN
jgi:hypothetical protein